MRSLRTKERIRCSQLLAFTEQKGVLAAVLVVGEPAVSSEPESGGEPAELNGVLAVELGNEVLAAGHNEPGGEWWTVAAAVTTQKSQS